MTDQDNPRERTPSDDDVITDNRLMTREQIDTLRVWRVYGVPGVSHPVLVRAHRLSVGTTGVLMFFTVRGIGEEMMEYLHEGFKEYTNWKEDVADTPERVH